VKQQDYSPTGLKYRLFFPDDDSGDEYDKSIDHYQLQHIAGVARLTANNKSTSIFFNNRVSQKSDSSL
jgi:hypothetical protein